MLFPHFWKSGIIKKISLSDYAGANTTLFDAFPEKLKYDVSVVSKLLPKKVRHDISIEKTAGSCTYTLLDGQLITFPYRIYNLYESKNNLSLTFEQSMIYHCIYSRSNNGFVREKHINEILMVDYPDWCIPYILKLSDEYVVQILETIYNVLKDKNTDKVKMFCKLNMQSFLYGYARMVSYWNEFYRNQCYFFKDYIGKKLFSECFGYTRSMEKERVKKQVK